MQEKDRVGRKIVFCGEIAGFACCKVMPGCCIVIYFVTTHVVRLKLFRLKAEGGQKSTIAIFWRKYLPAIALAQKKQSTQFKLSLRRGGRV